ncbi:MAG: maltose alpha-D-glucosyltransferase [Leptolyngbya sp. SIO4C1]|nr:maltose alpha-D-glucosyltransferase [Leptolyngbya sp. SIO4C1]
MTLDNSPLWFKSAIIYEVPVRAYADSNGDGIGDFRGLTEKLDYLQELGVTAVWVLPFFPSPLRDDGYDISDYTSVNSIYGNLDDFKAFLTAAHQRDIRVIIELIVNHTSDQHPWFQRARRAPKDSSERDFYVWSDTPEKYKDTRIIFQDFEASNWTWDPVAKAYYWHRFYSHQPDINYDNPAVQQAVFDVLDFWLSMGVDGLRMDAVPYLYEREGTNCENLEETHDFLKKLRQYVDDRYDGRMLLAEANQWPEDAAAYYGDGDECHMNFHFPLMPRLFMSLRMEDNFPIIDILQQTPEIPENCQWGLFLRNHDELTLEMVTDEDRDYMYRVYAQDPEMRLNLGIRRRLAPLLENDRRQIELLNGLLLSLPGTPVLYYGDEIGMGDNVYLGDRNGVRTPMQWSPDRNAGFSRANPHRLYLPLIVESEYHYTAINVEAQRANPNSLLNWTKRLIATRKRYQAFGWGDFQLLHPDNRKVLAFIRSYEDEQIMVVANLSRFVQTVKLDLSAFKGRMPVEIFGRTEFPPIEEDGSYFLSLSPYAFYWLTLKPNAVPLQPPTDAPTLTINSWEAVMSQTAVRTKLETLLPHYLVRRQWLSDRVRKIRTAQIVETIALSERETQMLCLRIEYQQGDPVTYLLFASCATGETARQLLNDSASAIIAQLRVPNSDEVGVIYDAIASHSFLHQLLNAIMQNRAYNGMTGKLVAKALISDEPRLPSDTTQLKGEYNNTSVIYYDGESESESHLILKLFRKVEDGINPDLEIRRFLGEQGQFHNFNAIAGYLDYHRTSGETATVGILQAYIPDAQNSWEYTLDSIRSYFDQVAVQLPETEEVLISIQSPLALQANYEADTPAKRLATRLIGTYLANIQLLGQRTAEFHKALASATEAAFAPEPFSSFHQRSIYQYNRNLTGRVFLLLKEKLSTLPEDLRPLAQTVVDYQQTYLERFRQLLDHKITALRIRYHGDYHLGQALYTGKDFLLIDFEGEATRNVSERRMKRSPLRDVAAMLQSIHYAAVYGLRNEIDSGVIHPEQVERMAQWAQFWETWVSAAFLHGYFETAQQQAFLPKTEQEIKVLLNNYLLSRAVYDVGYKLNRRSKEIEVPLQRLLTFVESQPESASASLL